MSGKGNEAYERFDREMSAKYGHLYRRVDPNAPVREFAPATLCSATVGPIPKLDGEVCLCEREDGHEMPHECACGSWFEGLTNTPPHNY